jgi:hypothetical protein
MLTLIKYVGALAALLCFVYVFAYIVGHLALWQWLN